MRKPKTVTKDIQNWETKLITLQTDRDKAKSQEAKAIEKKKKVVLLAKTGDEQAGKKLAQAREDEIRATLEASEYNEAIEQCQGKLQGLETELTGSKQEAGLELIRECGEGQVERHTRVVKAMEEIASTQQESRQVMDRLRVELTALDFKELNLDADLYKLVANSISNTLYWLYPRSGRFERPAAAYHRRSDCPQPAIKLAACR